VRFINAFVIVTLLLSPVAFGQDGQQNQDAQSGQNDQQTQPQDQALAGEGDIEEMTVDNVFVETDLRQALSDISLQAGVPILVGESVQGTITLEFQDTPLPRALDLALASGGYVWAEKDGYILVGSPQQGSKLFRQLSETRELELNHVTAQEAINMLAPPMRKYVTSPQQPGSGQVQEPETPAQSAGAAGLGQQLAQDTGGDEGGLTVAATGGQVGEGASAPDTGRLVITAPPSITERIVSDINEFDQPSRHVMLEGRVVVLEEDAMLDLGVEWDFPSIQAGTVTGSTFTESGALPDAPWLVSVGLSQGQAFTNSLLLSLNLLKENQQISIVASPELVVSDGESANMGVVTEERFESSTGQGAFADADIEEISSGTTLDITPQIGENGKITLNMAVEVSNVVGIGERDDLPIVTRRTASSQVQLDDGGTAAIAGLMESRDDAIESRVPGFGDMPGLLGSPFRNDDVERQNNQLAVFVTATIVEDATDAEMHTDAAPKGAVNPEAFRQQLRDVMNQTEAEQEELSDALDESRSNQKQLNEPALSAANEESSNAK
jgi:type II secretory pathway component GspD/PulD (secretin)